MKTSILGSSLTAVGYLTWMQTLSVAVLVVTLISGLLTIAYTGYKWLNDIKTKRSKKSN
jgi:hypothetical protein